MIYAHFYEPEQFSAGMSAADVNYLLSDQDLLEIDLEALDLEGSLALAGDQSCWLLKKISWSMSKR